MRRDRGEAEDLCPEVFLQVWKKAGNSRSAGPGEEKPVEGRSGCGDGCGKK